MRLKNILTIGFLVAILSSCTVQKMIKTADKLYEDNSYYNAVDLYGEAYAKKENNSKLTNKIANTNRVLKDYVKAEEWYARTEELNTKAFPDATFYKALMMKNQGKYDEAKTAFESFIDGASVTTNLKSRAKLEIKGCELAQEMKDAKTDAEIEIVTGGLNNTLQDLSPKSLDENTVLMAALLPKEAIELETARDAKEDYYTKMYIASNEGGTWTRKMLSDNINSKNEHVGNGVITKDGKTMYFTKCTEKPSQVMKCNIFKSEKIKGEWAEADPMSSINKKGASTTQPALAYDALGNEILYFVSNRVGTKGGMDIYYAEIDKDGEFSSPKNLGSQINTKYDDVTPYYDEVNKKLYFSSEGQVGFGGLDIFSVEGFGGDITGEVKNVGFPINSSADDLYFALNDESTKGYIVSNRVGATSTRGETCCDDVFKISLTRDRYIASKFCMEDDPANCVPIGKIAASFYKVNNGDFDFIGETITKESEFFHFPLEEGFAYKMNGNLEGFWPSISTIDSVDIANMEGDTLMRTFYLKPVERVKIKNVYFAFDKSDIREMYGQEMDTVVSLMNKYTDTKLDISGHTDYYGTDEYNMKLSERRANEAKAYIVEKGIAETRIVAAGYGETMPIAPNKNEDGSDNKAGRAKNRRIEFKLTHMDADVKVKYEAQDPKTID